MYIIQKLRYIKNITYMGIALKIMKSLIYLAFALTVSVPLVCRALTVDIKMPVNPQNAAQYQQLESMLNGR